ncbi:conserved hypothetical protein [Xanthomonas citri pv. bilvae]|nr:conserved hypothetical protein [Xanthomonas citri pv. bilvae]
MCRDGVAAGAAPTGGGGLWVYRRRRHGQHRSCRSGPGREALPVATPGLDGQRLKPGLHRQCLNTANVATR